jgi:hypothetical protein
MQEQEKVNKARLIGYAVGLAALVAAMLWRWLLR